jgi:hypothetical protein
MENVLTLWVGFKIKCSTVECMLEITTQNGVGSEKVSPVKARRKR